MTTLDEVRRIALALPEVFEQIDGHRGGAVWRTKRGTVVWERPPGKTDLAQLAALGREWPPGVVLGIRVDGADAKAALLAGFPESLFTIPHFDGYPAVLARLDVIDPELLRELVVDAWLGRIPKRLAQQWLAEHGLAEEESGA